MFTLTMLIHDYEPCTVLARPRNRVMFDSLLVGLGCSPLPQQGAGDEDGCRDDGDQGQATAGFPGGAREPCALFVGGEEQALRFLRSHPGAFACVLVAEGEKGDASGLPPDRCFVVRVDDPGALALFMQEACGRIQLWQDRMKSSMLQNGSYQHLIDCSEDILGNFISLTDLSFRLLGWTRGIMPDDEVSRRLVEKGYHDAETIEVFREHRLFDIWERQGGLTVYEESLTAQTESASYIFRMQGTYFVHVIMRFNRRARTAALMDTFDIFIAHLETLVRRDWRERRGGGPVYTRTLAGLLSGKLTESTAIGEELAVAGIRREASFTVLVFSPGDSSGRAAASERHYFMSRLEGEFPDEKIIEYGSTLVLVHQGVPTGDGGASPGEARADLLSRTSLFLNLHRGACGCSDIVDSAFDLRFAYQQACFALSRSAVPPRMPAEGAVPLVLPFDACYLDFLLFGREENRDLDLFCRMRGPVARIARDDEAEGSGNLEVIVTYLSYERRATQAAKALYLHRNSLLYRIDALQRRYELDLDSCAFRQAFLIEYDLMVRGGRG